MSISATFILATDITTNMNLLLYVNCDNRRLFSCIPLDKFIINRIIPCNLIMN